MSLRSLATNDNNDSTIFTFYFLKTTYNENEKNSVTIRLEDKNSPYNIKIDETFLTSSIDFAYDQSLLISNLDQQNDDFSNLKIDISLKLKEWRNANANLRNIINLGYESYISGNIDSSNISFDNRIFIMVQKRFNNMGRNIAQKRGTKYFIFDEDSLDFNINISDFSINLSFIDNFEINSKFLKGDQVSDHINLDSDVEYTFEAKLLIIPRNFFTISTLPASEYQQSSIIYGQKFKEKEEIYNILLQNTNSMQTQTKIDLIHKILSQINQNNISSLNQLSLNILYDYCLKATASNNSIVIKKRELSQVNRFVKLISVPGELPVYLNKNNQKKLISFDIYLKINEISSDFKNDILIAFLLRSVRRILKSINASKNNIYKNSLTENLSLDNQIVTTFIANCNRNITNLSATISEQIVKLSVNIELNSFMHSAVDFSKHLINLKIQNVDLTLNIENFFNSNHSMQVTFLQDSYIKLNTQKLDEFLKL